MHDASAPNLPAPDAQAGASVRQVLRRTCDAEQAAQDAIAAEVPVALAYNGVPFVVMMATPGDLEDFALGFTLSEGIAAADETVRVEAIDAHLEGVSIDVRIPAARAAALAARRRSLEGRSGCGICGSESIEAVLRPPPTVPAGIRLEPGALGAALAALHARQPLNARTGATHAAAFADARGELRLVREDVGRHNALDKLVGAIVRGGADPSAGFALVTSRASYEMVVKAARAGFPLLAAISAPTALAVALADHAGLTLVGFARAAGHVVYSHPQRIPPPSAPADSAPRPA